MAGKYRAYPEYKDSGVEWLGEVPVHWGRAPIKYMALGENALFLDGDWIESKDIFGDEIKYITTGNVGDGAYREQGLGFITQETFEKLNCTEVFPGDVLIARLNEPVGRSCVVPDLGARIVTSVDNVIFRPDRKFNRQFIVYLFSNKDYYAHTSNLARGATMQRISRGLLGNIRIAFPSFDEQSIIADFLDHETAKIETLIEKQQQLIRLLKEKRQAVISHAVTKGLNPNVPMKDSGVEWLGEVPAHWVSAKLKHLAFQIVDGAHFTPTYVDEGVPFLRVTDIQCKTIDLASVKRIPLGEHNELVKRCRPEKGDLLLSKNGTIGVPKVVDWDWDFSIFVSLCLIKLKPQLVSSFAEYFFFSNQIEEQIGGLTKQSTVTNLHLEKIADFWFSVPSVEEQWEIVMYLDRRLEAFDKLIYKANLAISLMQERRTALISAAVTGKIDVRDWQPPRS